MQNIEQPQVEHTTISEDSGILRRSLTRMVVGVVLKGTMVIYHNSQRVEVTPNRVFLFEEGIHYLELLCKDGSYEHIIFPIESEVLRQTVVTMANSYNINCRSNHSCPKCRYKNFALCDLSAPLLNFFNSVANTSSIEDICTNPVFLQIKLSELLFLILSGDDNCVRKLLVRIANTEHNAFVQVVYSSVFTETSVGELAQQTNRSLSAFKKEFTACFNTSPHKWIVEQRLVQAEILLRSSSKSISEICDQCIFTNLSHFIRQFKNSYNSTPAEYRRAIREQKKRESE